VRCPNPNCIIRHEGAYLRPRFSLAPSLSRAAFLLRCDYCDRELRVAFVGHARSRRYYRFDESLYGYVRGWIDEGSLVAFDSEKQAEEHGYEPYRRGPQREIMNSEEVARACEALADQLVVDLPDLAGVAMIGVVSHGALLAMRLRDLIEARTGVRLPCALVDVVSGADTVQPLDGTAEFAVEGRTMVMVDDVINSGWTVQRAMTTLWKHGRPAAVKLAVLIDRGHRAVPIRPNYVGKSIPTARSERVQVRLSSPHREAGHKQADRVLLYSLVESIKEPETAR
jgi:pyrimidine operon attenuation protein / uracil phosphoribosyltransferase